MCFGTFWTVWTPKKASPKFVICIVMRCAIWYHLCNLKNVKNTHERVIILVKLKWNNEIVYEYFRNKNLFKRHKCLSKDIKYLTWLVHTNSPSSIRLWYLLNSLTLRKRCTQKTSGCDTVKERKSSMQGKGGKASFDSFLKFYKAFTTKYEYKKKCFNYYVETIPRTMKKE